MEVVTLNTKLYSKPVSVYMFDIVYVLYIRSYYYCVVGLYIGTVH